MGPKISTNLADGAHSSHVALVSGAEFRRGQQPCRVQAVQAPVDGNLTHRPQIAVTSDLQLGGVLCGDSAAREGGKKMSRFKKRKRSKK